MRITSAGNVGIGTSSATDRLEVAGVAVAGSATGGTTGSLVLRSRETDDFTRLSIGSLRSSGASYFGFAVEPSTTVGEGFNGGFTGTVGCGAWTIYNDGSTRYLNLPSGAMTKGSAVTLTERMRIDSAGNVGIGTSSPGGKLTVLFSTNSVSEPTLKLQNAGGSGQFLSFYSSDGTTLLGNFERSSGGGILFNSVDSHQFQVDDSEKMRIDSSGNVGIGGSGDPARLLVSELADLSEADPHFRIQGAGFSAYHWLDGTAYYIGQSSGSRSLRIYSSAETAGVNLAAGGTSWGTFSDERLKYDIEPIVDGLTKLANVRCVSYRLKDVDAEDSQKKLGVIAQDLVGVVDEVIDITKRSGDETDYMSVRYTELIPILTKAIQELKAELDTVKTELATLKGN
jgi:hypothetical protein